MKSYALEDLQLDQTTFEEAEKIDRECENYWFRDGQRLGRWVPTRELARNAYRTMDNMFYGLEKMCRRIQIIAAVEAIAIAGLTLLLAVKWL